MKNLYILAAFFAIALLACQAPTAADLNSSTVQKSLSSDAAKTHWENVQDESTVQALESLKNETTKLVSERKPLVMKDDAAPTVKDPVMPQDLVASVQVRAANNLDSYRGVYQVREVNETVIRGLVDGETEFNIFYKIPNASLTESMKAEQRVNLSFNAQYRDGSFNQVLFLVDDDRPFFISIEEGAMQPFEKVYDDLKLAVRQVIVDGENTGAVDIRFAGDRFRLKQGESRVVDGPRGPVEFFLYISYMRPKEAMEEGMNYFVRLFATAK